ncbi:MAG: HAMP domain-containing sensor histidine kinase [Niameybacter sp.]|uniref:sensor histidine kinase n=1 Tax=Niameybacter sp. TaxID=2033640 RepID=UPI002FC9B85E
MGLRKRSLKSIFIEYMGALVGTSLLMMALVVLVMNVCIQTGIILPANYEEDVALAARALLQGRESLSVEDLPRGCEYALYNHEGQVLSTNLKEEELPGALRFLKTKEKEDNINQYVVIEGEKEWAVIQYQLLAKYKSPMLQQYLPSAELLFLMSLIVSMLVGVSLVSSIYANKLKRGLLPLQEAVEHIKSQDLNFQVQTSPIQEFAEISASLEQMKEALKTSLQTQWNLEKAKQEQMAAIAHDIKTPLTIIKGNAELLVEDETLDEEQQTFSTYILKNSRQIQDYIQRLLDISTAKQIGTLNKTILSLESFMGQVVEQAKGLADIKGINIQVAYPRQTYELKLDQELMNRALLNIISNGIDYTRPHSRLSVEARIKEDGQSRQLEIAVLDEGEGFSQKSLQNACNEFYMGEESRNRKGHYGMGLHIAKQIVTLHGGELMLTNRTEQKGGKVVITIPLGDSIKTL